MKKNSNKASDTFLKRFQGKCSLIPLSGIATIVNDKNASSIDTSNYSSSALPSDNKLVKSNNQSIFSKNYSEYYNTGNKHHRKFYGNDTGVVNQLTSYKSENNDDMDIQEFDRQKWMGFKGQEYNFNSQDHNIDLSKSKTIELRPNKQIHSDFVKSKKFYKNDMNQTNRQNDLDKKFVDAKLKELKNKKEETNKLISRKLPTIAKVNSSVLLKKIPRKMVKNYSQFDIREKKEPELLKNDKTLNLSLAKSEHTQDYINLKVKSQLLNENRQSLPKLEIDPQFHLKKNSSKVKIDNFVKKMDSEKYKAEFTTSKKRLNDLNQKILDIKYNKVNTVPKK